MSLINWEECGWEFTVLQYNRPTYIFSNLVLVSNIVDSYRGNNQVQLETQTHFKKCAIILHCL